MKRANEHRSSFPKRKFKAFFFQNEQRQQPTGRKLHRGRHRHQPPQQQRQLHRDRRNKVYLGGGLDGADACVALDGQLEVREGDPLEGDQLSVDAGVGALDESLIIHSGKNKRESGGVGCGRHDRGGGRKGRGQFKGGGVVHPGSVVARCACGAIDDSSRTTSNARKACE